MNNSKRICLVVLTQILIFCVSIVYSQVPILGRPNNFIYGVNGHPLNSIDYFKISIFDQLNLIKQLNLTSYRIDLSIGVNTGLPTNESKFDSLYTLAAQQNISLLPMIYLRVNNKQSEQFNFDRGRKMAEVFFRKYKNIQSVELGNESNMLFKNILLNEKPNRNSSDYKKFSLHAAFLKGMIAGIKAASPSTRTVIDFNGKGSWYLKALDKFGVNFDVIGFHIYTNKTWQEVGCNSILNDIVNYFDRKRPVWITEYNFSPKDQESLKLSVRTNSISYAIKNAKELPMVEALYFYELLDQPSLIVPKDRYFERNFGISSFDKAKKLGGAKAYFRSN